MTNKLIIRNTLRHYAEPDARGPIFVEPDKTKSISELSRRELGEMIDRIGSERQLQSLIREMKRNSGERDTYDTPFKIDTSTPINQLYHHGVKGMKWGVRRYQNQDGSLTPRGQARLDKKDNKWAETKGEKIRVKTQKSVAKDMQRYTKTQLDVSYTSRGRLSSKTILDYNNQLASLMNERVSGVQAPSGRVLKFVAKRGDLGVHTAIADAGYDINQLKRGVFKSGKVAYKKQNLMKGGG